MLLTRPVPPLSSSLPLLPLAVGGASLALLAATPPKVRHVKIKCALNRIHAPPPPHTHPHSMFIFFLAALCINMSFSLRSGKFLSQSELLPSIQLLCALAKGASIQGMGQSPSSLVLACMYKAFPSWDVIIFPSLWEAFSCNTNHLSKEGDAWKSPFPSGLL